MLVQNGAWGSRQLIAPDVLRATLTDAGMPPDLAARNIGDPSPATSLGWWSNADGHWRGIPRDAVLGAGAGDQLLLIIPSLELVAVRNGGDLVDAGDRHRWQARLDLVVRPVVDSLALRSPVPSSAVITGIDWDPPGQVRRTVLGGHTRDGSDNWPLTWADDGNLYTAYGDGYGFEPQQTADKLSLGYAVITGGPHDFVGYNIRSDGERLGPGRKGEKASGLLCVDGVIYIWVRNADGDGNCGRLGWSMDHMKTWEWAYWSFAEFGHPSFINFGRNYADARDDYVYILSHDHTSAYEQADRFLLARVPQDRIREPAFYEFFVGTSAGAPRWSADLSDCGAIFTHPGQCRRSSMSYVPGLDRYLLWQQLTTDGSDTRFRSGFGLYDAPEPWGPWTTVFFTDRWDIGPGDLDQRRRRYDLARLCRQRQLLRPSRGAHLCRRVGLTVGGQGVLSDFFRRNFCVSSIAEYVARSSRGLGRRPLTAVARVRIPYGLPSKVPEASEKALSAPAGGAFFVVPHWIRMIRESVGRFWTFPRRRDTFGGIKTSVPRKNSSWGYLPCREKPINSRSPRSAPPDSRGSPGSSQTAGGCIYWWKRAGNGGA